MPTLVYKTVGHSQATATASTSTSTSTPAAAAAAAAAASTSTFTSGGKRPNQHQPKLKTFWSGRIDPFEANANDHHSAVAAVAKSTGGDTCAPAHYEHSEQAQQRHGTNCRAFSFRHHQSALDASARYEHSSNAAYSSAASGAQPAAAASRPLHMQQQAVLHAQQAFTYPHHHRQDRHFGDNYSPFEYSSSLQQQQHHHHHQQQAWHSTDNSRGAGTFPHHHYQQPPPQHPRPNVTPPPIYHAPDTDDSFSNISDLVIQEQIDRAAQMLEEAQSTSYEDFRGKISQKMPPTPPTATTVVTPPGPYAPAAHPSPQSLVHPSVSEYSYGMDHPTSAHHPPDLRDQRQQEQKQKHPRPHASTHQPVHVHVHVHPKLSEKKARSTEKGASPTTTTTTTTVVDEHKDTDGDTLQYDLQYDIPPSLVGQRDQYQSFICDHVARRVKDIMHAHPNYSKGKAKAVSIRTKVLSKKKLPKTKKGARPSTTSTIPISPISSHRKNKEAASTASSKKQKGTSPSTTTKTTTTIQAAINTEGVALKQAIPLGLGSDDRKFLDDYYCFIRNSCIEVFSATTSGVVGKREAPRSVKTNQVGIRCRFCAYRSRADRKLYSTAFPKNVCNIYNIAVKMGHNHLSICPDMPPDIKERYNVLKAAKFISKRGTMQHWIESAHALGLVDTETGIRMTRPVASPESQA